MSNVFSLESKRLEKLNKKTPYADGELEIDFDDVVRLISYDKDGTPNLTLEDKIELGPKAYAQIKEIFWRYGLRQIPQSWGELEGNWNYCRLLRLYMIAMTPDESAAVKSGLIARHNKRSPGMGDIIRLLERGNLDEVHALHIERDAFRQNASNPKYMQNQDHNEVT